MYKNGFALITFLFGVFTPASAATIFDNGGPNHLGGSDMVLSLEADNFTVSAQSTLMTAQFWDFETSGGGDYAGSISWSIFTNSSNNPGTLLFSGSASGVNVTRVATGVLDPSKQFVEYSDTFTFSGTVSLAAGTYWLALHNGPTASVNPNSLANFAWENTATACSAIGSNPCGRAQDLTASGSPFLSTLTDNAFNLSGTVSGVPEPGSLSLLGAGLLSFALFTRRSRDQFANFRRKQ